MDYPYLPWEMEVTEQLQVENFLVVRIEASPRPDDTIPLFGWRNYAGILRPVSLRITGSARLRNVLLDPLLNAAKGTGQMAVRFDLDTLHAESGLNIRWRLSGQGLALSGEEPVSRTRGKWCKFTTQESEVRLWSPESPALYTFELQLLSAEGKILDEYRCETGFRKFEARPGKGFFLNGQPVWLRGISRQNLHEQFGMTMNSRWLKTDIDLVQELNCNALRLAHYTNDRCVLEECDRRGLLVWAEIPVYWEAKLENPEVLRKMLDQFERLILRDYNHPSVVLWSAANEIRSERPEGLQALQEARRVLRKLDKVRPMTFASWPRDPEHNLGLQCIDFCSMNLYRGWYNSSTSQLAKDIEPIRRFAPDLPIVLSEFGAGAVAGRHGSKNTPWTEEFQVRVIRDNLHTIRELGQGCFLWLLNDFLDPSRVHSRITGGFMNNKGLVTADRRKKKLAFALIRKIYGKWKREDEK